MLHREVTPDGSSAFESGPILDKKVTDEDTALWHAASNGDNMIAQLLLGRGAAFIRMLRGREIHWRTPLVVRAIMKLCK